MNPAAPAGGVEMRGRDRGRDLGSRPHCYSVMHQSSTQTKVLFHTQLLLQSVSQELTEMLILLEIGDRRILSKPNDGELMCSGQIAVGRTCRKHRCTAATRESFNDIHALNDNKRVHLIDSRNTFLCDYDIRQTLQIFQSVGNANRQLCADVVGILSRGSSEPA